MARKSVQNRAPKPTAPMGDSVGAAAFAIEEAFKSDQLVQAKLSEQLRTRTDKAAAISAKAGVAFKQFAPSKFTSREREPRNYLADGENLATAMDRVVKRGVERMRNASGQGSIKLRLTPELTKAVTETDGNGAQMVLVPALINLLNIKLATAPTLRDEPAFTLCAAEREVQRRMDEVEGKTSPPATPPASDAPAVDEPELETTDKFVARRVHGLLAKMPSPEEQPILVTPERADHKVVKRSIETFELRSGPSDVTSYHDFNSLQIAFEHIWAEVFDARLGDLGRELYETYIEMIDFLGYQAQPLDNVTSIDDIATLISNASLLGRNAEKSIPQALTQDLASVFTDVRNALVAFLQPVEPQIGGPGSLPVAIDTKLMPLSTAIQKVKAATAVGELGRALPSVKRLTALLTKLNELLSQPYAFTVFKKNSSNFGIMVTYRQKWVPENYQVGDLVSTIPLAPRETRRYTSKQVTKKSRTRKEVENNLNASKTDIGTTSRTDREIVENAENRTNFKVTADGSFGTDANKIHATGEAGGNSAKISHDTKKNFHEAVLKSAQEYKHDNRMEVETVTSDETESTTFHEIQNPNDELTVTYLFYELQRTYQITERIHQVTPVVLVANEVPAPNAIDDAWLVKHDWILRRVLLDDSFRPALEYLTSGFVGDELNLQILDNNVQAQRQLVDAIKSQVATQISIVEAAQRDLSAKMDVQGGLQFAEGILGTVKKVFDPFGLTGQSVTGTSEGMQTVADYAQESLGRAEREKIRLLDQVSVATTAMQGAIDKLAAATREHYDKVAQIDRLRLHVKENILYYMQAIWNHEPPDQRYFRVFQVKVPVVEPKTATGRSPLMRAQGAGFLHEGLFEAAIPFPEVDITWKPLVEIADLDEVLGYKGNYAIYRLKENNYLTLHMMQNYLEVADEIKIRDPDDLANYTVEELQELAACLYRRKPTVYETRKKEIKELIMKRLTSGRAEDDRVVVPTKSLYIEALVGTHPLLEDFKLLHRALDVKKVQAEVRRTELENVRLAARALKGQHEDPDVEKKIVIETDTENLTVQPDA